MCMYVQLHVTAMQMLYYMFLPYYLHWHIQDIVCGYNVATLVRDLEFTFNFISQRTNTHTHTLVHAHTEQRRTPSCVIGRLTITISSGGSFFTTQTSNTPNLMMRYAL